MPSPADQRPYLAQLREWDNDEARNAAGRIEKLLESPAWDDLQRLLRETEDNALTRLIGGQLPEDREAARLIGFLSGLRQSKAAAEAFLTYAERQGREDTTNP